MPEIRVQHVISSSSEEKNYPAVNLAHGGDGFKKWKCQSGEKQAVVTLQFEKEAEIVQIDIGNEGSAFIEVLVGKSSTKVDDYQVILVASSFMTPQDSRASQNLNKVRMFSSDLLSKAVAGQKWDRAKVICTQPFNKNLSYGLSFIKFHSTPAVGAADPLTSVPARVATTEPIKRLSLGAFSLKEDIQDSNIKTGTLFEKNRQKSVTLPISGAAAIRDASRAVAEAAVVSVPAVSTESVPPSASKNSVSSNISGSSASADRNNLQAPAKIKRDHSDRSNSSGSDRSSVTGEADQLKRRDESNLRKSSLSESRPSASALQPPTKKLKSSKEEEERPGRPLNVIMSGVRFVLSGLENPLRGQLRDMAIQMGAIYKPDWDKQCTHLICAFDNTPKYQQVRGLGRIVTKDWIEDCHRQKRLLPWRKYRLGKAASPPPTDTELNEEVEPSKKQTELGSKVGTNEHVNKQPGGTAGNLPSEMQTTSATGRLPLDRQGSVGSAKGEEGAASSKQQPRSKGQTLDTQDLFDASTDSECDELMPKPCSTSSNSTVDHRPKLSPAKVCPPSSTGGGANPSSDLNRGGGRRGAEIDIFNASTDEELDELPELDAPKKHKEPEGGVVTAKNGVGAGGGEEEEGDLPALPDFFEGKIFFLYGTFDTAERRSINRYIVAYGGSVEEYMEKKVNIVISTEDWDENFDLALTDNSSLLFVRPAWIHACYERQNVVPHQKYLIVP